MTTALEGGEGSASRLGRFLPPGKTRYPLYRRLGGPQDRSGQVRKISPPNRIRYPDRPVRSQSLYRLRYPAHINEPNTKIFLKMSDVVNKTLQRNSVSKNVRSTWVYLFLLEVHNNGWRMSLSWVCERLSTVKDFGKWSFGLLETRMKADQEWFNPLVWKWTFK